MEYLQKMPFILGTLMAIITGVISYETDVDQQEIYLKMAISMIVFFTVGVYIRNSILKIIDELKNKRDEEEKKKKAEEEKNEKEKNEAENLKKTNTSAVDYKVNDESDDFIPLKVSEVIRKELKK